jgi:hypothetical protein
MRYLLLSLLLATTAFAADTDSDQAGAAAMNFINGYVKASNNRNWDAKLIADGFKQNPEVGLGADPVIDGNDCPERYTVKSAKAKDDTASVVLTGPKDFPAELKLRLVKSDGKWLVDASGMMLK